jgi:succinate dehydrogenase/fumarate reductase flavoprotein subunit
VILLNDVLELVEPSAIIQADVLVVGGGPAGLMAACAAARSGAHVLLLESSDVVGGNAIWATGYLALVDTPRQRSEGIADGFEVFLGDARREVERDTEFASAVIREETLRVFCRESGRAFEQLEDIGLEFGRFIRRPSLHSVDRLIAVDNIDQLGQLFAERLDSMGVNVSLRTRAKRVIHGEDGSIAGVWAEQVRGDDDLDHTIGSWDLARGRLIRTTTVVLTAGGIQGSSRLRSLYGPEHHASIPHQGIDTCVGDGHVIASAVGAELFDMHIVPRLVQVGSGFVQDTIAVNADGARFHDEPGRYEDRVKALERQPMERAYYIADADIAERHVRITSHMPGAHLEAPTIAALAEQIGCDPATLERTVSEWNAVVRAGGPDDAFGRSLAPVGAKEISIGPFHAFALVVGVGFSAGGVFVDEEMTVLDSYGDPIDGLYAAGDVVAGLNSAGGLGGTHIASAVTFGMVAGESAARHACAEPPWV